jgi:flavin-dependent dehydrogenase
MSCGADADVVVVGGGPAGTATAIWAALGGARVTLLERSAFPRHRPGETLHPGTGALFEQLGVEPRVAAACRARHAGITVEWAGRRSTQTFADATRAGYQILRDDLDAILLSRARDVGVAIVQPSPSVAPIIDDGRVLGVRCRDLWITASAVVDATGSAWWLGRHLGLVREVASPPLYVHYGYCEGTLEPLRGGPSLTGDALGWTWMAEIAPGLIHWTRLRFERSGDRARPPALDALPARGPIRGADVTWRTTRAAGPGYFLVGDAAAVLDPSSSHGVLRAVMSGMMAAHTIGRLRAGAVDEPAAIAGFVRWTADWFQHDVRRMSALYFALHQEADLARDDHRRDP